MSQAPSGLANENNAGVGLGKLRQRSERGRGESARAARLRATPDSAVAALERWPPLPRARASFVGVGDSIDQQQQLARAAQAREILCREIGHVERLVVDAEQTRPAFAQQTLAQRGECLTLLERERRRELCAFAGVRADEVFDHLRHRAPVDVAIAVGAAHASERREQQAPVSEDFGRAADGGARVGDAVALLDRDRRRQMRDEIDVGSRKAFEELSRVRRERRDVAALPFGVERFERSVDLPDPDGPVTTVRLRSGMVHETLRRLLERAPTMRISRALIVPTLGARTLRRAQRTRSRASGEELAEAHGLREIAVDRDAAGHEQQLRVLGARQKAKEVAGGDAEARVDPPGAGSGCTAQTSVVDRDGEATAARTRQVEFVCEADRSRGVGVEVLATTPQPPRPAPADSGPWRSLVCW